MADYRTEHEDEGGGEAPAQKEPASQPGMGSTQSFTPGRGKICLIVAV